MKISKRHYKKAINIVNAYESQQIELNKKKKRAGLYKRLISAKNPHKAIEKFMKMAPISLKWIDEDLERDGESFYVGDHPLIKQYL